jgi:hypothetical protein
MFTKFHVKFHGNSAEKLMNKKNFSKNYFHEIPGGTSRYIRGIFLDPELRKISVGTFYSGNKNIIINSSNEQASESILIEVNQPNQALAKENMKQLEKIFALEEELKKIKSGNERYLANYKHFSQVSELIHVS